MGTTKFRTSTYTPPSGRLTKFKINLDDLDSENTGRGQTGYMLRDRIRGDIVTASFTYEHLTDAQVTEFLNAISAESFTAYIWYKGAERQLEGYASGKNVEETSDYGIPQNTLTFNFIEN